MKKQMKRITALVCTLALATTGIVFTPNKAVADDGWIHCSETTTVPDGSVDPGGYPVYPECAHWRFQSQFQPTFPNCFGNMDYYVKKPTANPDDFGKYKFRKNYDGIASDTGKPLGLDLGWDSARIYNLANTLGLVSKKSYRGTIVINSSKASYDQETGTEEEKRKCKLRVTIFGSVYDMSLEAGNNTLEFDEAIYDNPSVKNTERRVLSLNLMQMPKKAEISVESITMEENVDPFTPISNNVDVVPSKDGVNSPWTLRANNDGSTQWGQLSYAFNEGTNVNTVQGISIKTVGSVGEQEKDTQGNPVDPAHRWWWVSGVLKNYATTAGLEKFSSYTGSITFNTDKATDTDCRLFVYIDGKEYPFSLTAGENTLTIPEFMYKGVPDDDGNVGDIKFLFDELPKNSIVSVSDITFTETSSGGWTRVPNADDSFTVGPWNMFGNFIDQPDSGNYGVLQYKANKENPSKYSDYSMRVASASGWLAWSVFARLENYCADYLDPGDPYDLTIKLNSTKATVPKPDDPAALDKLLVLVGNETFQFSLTEGENTLNIHSDGYTVGEGTNYHEQIMFEMDGLQEGTELTVEDIQLTCPNNGWTNVPNMTDHKVGDWTLFAWNDESHWSKMAYRNNESNSGIGAYDIKVRRTTSNGAFTNMATLATLEDYLTTAKTTHGKSLIDGDAYDVSTIITASSLNDSISSFGKVRAIINGKSFDFRLKKGTNTYDLTDIAGEQLTYDATKDKDVVFELDEVTPKSILNISNIQFVDDDEGAEEVPNATAFNPEGTPWTLYAETNAVYNRYGKLKYLINGDPSKVSSLTMILKSVSGWHDALALRATLRNVLNGLTKDKEYRLTMNVHIDESGVKDADKQVSYDKQLRIYIGDTPHDRDVRTTGVGTETFVETFKYNGTDKHIGLGLDQLLKGTKLYVESFTIEPTDVPTSSVTPTTTEEQSSGEPTSSVVPTTTEEQSSVVPTSTEESSSVVPTSTEESSSVVPTTTKENPSEVTSGVNPESSSDVTSSQAETGTVKAPSKAKIKKIYKKKKSAKKIKLKLKKVSGATGYQVAVYKSKKTAKKNKKALVKKYTKKLKVTIKSKKLKNKKKLFVRARAYVLDLTNKKVFGKWSAVKKAKIKR